MRVVEAAEAEVELRREERRTHICVPVRLVRKMRCRFGCSVGPCFLVPKILYAMQNGFGSPDACFVGDSLRGVDAKFAFCFCQGIQILSVLDVTEILPAILVYRQLIEALPSSINQQIMSCCFQVPNRKKTCQSPVQFWEGGRAKTVPMCFMIQTYKKAL